MPAETSNSGKIGFLDNIRLNNGIDSLKSYFHDLLINNAEKATELANDGDLHYCSLFSLQEELETLELKDRLNERNRTALRITRDVYARDSEDMHLLTQGRNEHTLSVLRWMLGTGYADDGLSDRYETVMEQTAILLSRTYKDDSLLGEIAEMIFSRNRRGLFLHHLVWAFFEARSPYSLTFLANRLCSEERCDAELAKKLLAFIPSVGNGSEAEGRSLYHAASGWIQENRLFMYYTGESLHQAVNPLHYNVSLEAKYMCRPVSAEDGSFLRAGDEKERSLADSFNQLEPDDKILLSDFSYLLYRRNLHQWNTWMKLPLDEQKKLAQRMMGGSV